MWITMQVEASVTQLKEQRSFELWKKDNELYEPSIFSVSPICQILQISNEVRLLEYTLLGERVQVKWISQGLDKFEFKLKTGTVLRSRVRFRGWMSSWRRFHSRRSSFGTSNPSVANSNTAPSSHDKTYPWYYLSAPTPFAAPSVTTQRRSLHICGINPHSPHPAMHLVVLWL